jgi:hypothetical protein
VALAAPSRGQLASQLGLWSTAAWGTRLGYSSSTVLSGGVREYSRSTRVEGSGGVHEGGREWGFSLGDAHVLRLAAAQGDRGGW